MKTITAREHDLIISVMGEGLTALAEAVIEKDLLITEVLRTVVAVDSVGIQLVFCGGTCLSKAHGLIERMSEDIDFKLVLPQGLSRSARSRLLSQFKKRLAAALMEAGFAVPADEIIARVSMAINRKALKGLPGCFSAPWLANASSCCTVL